MSENSPKTVYLKDFTPPPYFIDEVELAFHLHPDKTRVESLLKCRRNPEAKQKNEPLILNGEELTLESIALNDKPLAKNEYKLDEETLTLQNLPEQFNLRIVNEIHPEKNTALSGLYKSNKLYCTQCEAEGFRRITYYLDRPDVMAKFTTTIYADKAEYPVLLSNGNCIETGEESKTRHFAKWQDPFKKPCYLFALVAGDLVALEDHFVTQSGRLVNLKIFIERENQDRCAHAMRALKQAMKWDEVTYGREYDLDIYMIVAVNDFNMGAMENKGLNIFNSTYILARPETATDTDFQNIDVVVGHEYFHNWSGNRVTCRDWFQLSLKEGLTVFREQQFSSDISKSAVALIEQAGHLRERQFSEDASPLAHPVRPESYVEINNFYTSTIYEKGAELIRMLKTLLGWETFRKGMDLYFERHDGQAVTTDDFVAAMEDVSKRDLSQFKLWYSQAGTPEITVSEQYDAAKKTYLLTLKQFCPPTPKQEKKLPMHIPIAVGLLGKNGKNLLPETTQVLELRKTEETFEFKNINEQPTLSILRDFSAPVKIKSPLTDESLSFLLAQDSDAFNRWDAGQTLSERFIFRLADQLSEDSGQNKNSGQNKKLDLDPLWFEANQKVLEDKNIDLALKTEILSLPSISYLLEQSDDLSIDALYQAKKYILKETSNRWREILLKSYHENRIKGPYHYTTELAAKRSFRNFCLNYLMEDPTPEIIQLCMEQWHHANNMTDSMAAVYALIDTPCKERDQMIEEFYERAVNDPLQLNKWFRAQALADLPQTLDIVQHLMKHPAFDIKNPNKVYALIGAFASGNVVRFHDKSGKAYSFLADIIIQLDGLNPQVASRMCDPFTRWQRFDDARKDKMQKELLRIQKTPKLSKDVFEIVEKCLASA